jgi:DNA-binding response OmpR family regulator
MSSIILIDDNHLLRDSIKQVLISNGHSVSDADNGKSGLELIKREKPDVIITDIVMPEMDGLTLINEIKALETNAKLIAISGELTPENKVFNSVVERLADVVLAKPASMDLLLKHIN